MNEGETRANAREIVVDELFPHAPETIWKTLTSGELMGRWLGMAPSGFAPVVGFRSVAPRVVKIRLSGGRRARG